VAAEGLSASGAAIIFSILTMIKAATLFLPEIADKHVVPAIPKTERMIPLDDTIAQCAALVVDPNPTSRSILTCQLRDLGIGTVVQCGQISDARRRLEVRPFDFVLCEMDFPGAGRSGQELIEDLRRNQLLPLATIFVMVSGESTYARVAEVAESALDSYLIKPYTANSLEKRLRHARHRKQTLHAIFEAIEADDLETAAALCLRRFEGRSRYWLYAARLGAELLLRLERHEEASVLFESIVASQALPWARLGIARAQLAANEVTQAKRTLESLIAEQPSYADAYDVMGRVQVEQGNLTEALEIYAKAADTTPGSISRQQKLGMLAFYMGDTKAATLALNRAMAMGKNSRMFDFQSIVLLAFTQFLARDSKGLHRCVADLTAAQQRIPNSRRLARFVEVVEVLSLMSQRQVGAVVARTREMARELRHDSFDVEAACNMLSLISQLTAAEIKLPDAESWVDQLALRFCTSKGYCELLARTASVHPPFADRVRLGHGQISQLIQQSMMHSVTGDPATAVKALRSHAESTLNMRIIEAARAMLQRHEEKIEGATQLCGHTEAMQRRYGSSAEMPRLGAEVGRQAGGLSMRGAKTFDESDRPNGVEVDSPG